MSSVATMAGQTAGPARHWPDDISAQIAKASHAAARSEKAIRARPSARSVRMGAASSASMSKKSCSKDDASSARGASFADLSVSRQNSTIVLPPVMPVIVASFSVTKMPCYQNLTQAR